MIVGPELIIAPNSAYAQELVKWEAHYTKHGPPGRPYVYREYPARMYKAFRPPQGGVAFEGETAEDERDRERLERIGFVYGGQDKALEALEAREFEIAELAANRPIADAGMSARAKAEAAAAEAAAGIQHLGEIPAAHPKTGQREVKR